MESFPEPEPEVGQEQDPNDFFHLPFSEEALEIEGEEF